MEHLFRAGFTLSVSLSVASLFVSSVFNAIISISECNIERVDDIEFLMDLKTIEPISSGLFKVSSQHFLGGTE